MNLIEHQDEVKKLKKLEKELTRLIIDKNDQKLSTAFFKWQDQRNACNEGFVKFVGEINNTEPVNLHYKLVFGLESDLSVRLISAIKSCDFIPAEDWGKLTIKDLSKFTKNDFCKGFRFGKKSLIELERIFKKAGLNFKM